MGFIMDGLDGEAYDRRYTDRHLLARILTYFRPHVPIIGFVTVMIVLNSVANIGLPLLIARGIDTLTGAKTLQTIALFIGAIMVSGVLAWVFNFFRQIYTARLVGDVVLDLQREAFAAVMERDMSFYDEYSSGRIVSRVTSDTESFSTVATLVLNLLSQLLLAVLIAGALFYINVQLALLTLAVVPLILLIALTFRRVARRTTQWAQRARGSVNAIVQESISGISIAKNFRQEQSIYHDFCRVNEQSYQVNLRQGLVFSTIFPTLNTAAGIGTAIVVYFGGLDVLGHSVSAGAWYLFVQSIAIFWFPLTSIASFWSQFQQGLSASERVFALIDAEPRVRQSDTIRLSRVAGQIECRDLSFRYNEQQAVFGHFNVTIRAGETIALVGHTGSGKSSLAKLIARFYEYQDGQLLIDGYDIRTLDLHTYRKHLSIVPQVPFLFSGTVADNIRYAQPEATDEAVLATAFRIGGGDWLEALPKGLETDVGEQGSGLSMGQQQLIALARVLLQDPSIIILDEATASVDPLTEAQIQEGLNLVLKNRTAIVIAHRLSTVKNADRIIVLHHGRIIEEGNHETLLGRGGHYAHLYNTYFRHQSSDYQPGTGFVSIQAAG